MNSFLRALFVVAAIAMLVSKCGSAPGAAKAPDADVVVTAAPVYHPLAALRGENRFPKGAQLLRIHQGK